MVRYLAIPHIVLCWVVINSEFLNRFCSFLFTFLMSFPTFNAKTERSAHAKSGLKGYLQNLYLYCYKNNPYFLHILHTIWSIILLVQYWLLFANIFVLEIIIYTSVFLDIVLLPTLIFLVIIGVGHFTLL